jgi:tRNA threonylcarbamoyladenosine biosynthesis protein TsaB
MALILNLETSTPACSVALSNGSEVLAYRESFEDKSHATLLTLFVEQVLHEAGKNVTDLQAVAVSSGPGSYTGLRIGVSTAKGLCYGLNLPLIAIDTLTTMTLMAQEHNNMGAHVYCPMLDARRMEVYTALYNNQLHQVEPVKAEIIDDQSFAIVLANQKMLFFGNGADKCKTVITSPNAFFIDDIHPLARYMAPLAALKFEQQQFVDVAYYEPLYLKDFVATVPKNKVL